MQVQSLHRCSEPFDRLPREFEDGSIENGSIFTFKEADVGNIR